FLHFLTHLSLHSFPTRRSSDLGIIPGILLTSFFFGAIHIDPHQGAMAMLLGIFLHYVYLTTRSLWMPMLLHFLVNSFSVTADKRSEEHTSELQSRGHLVCRLLL